MKASNLLLKTLRDIPSDAENISHRLLLRAGYVQQVAAGIFSLLPIGNRSISKIRKIEKINGKKLSLIADLQGVNLTNANLKNTNLIGANLTGAILDNTNFSNANINDIILDDVNLQNIKFDSSL